MFRKLLMLVLCTGLASTTFAEDNVVETISLAECPIDFVNNWYPGIKADRKTITEAEPGWHIILEYEMIDGKDSNSFALTTSYGKWNLPGFEGSIQDPSEPQRYRYPITGDGSYTYVITQDAIDKMKTQDVHGWDGVRLVGDGIRIIRYDLVKGPADLSGIEDIINDEANSDNVEYYNLNGIKVSNPTSKGVYIRKQGSVATKIVIR